MCSDDVISVDVYNLSVGGQTAECSASAVEAAQTLDCMHNHPVVLLLEWT